jgi:hypothetical protein
LKKVSSRNGKSLTLHDVATTTNKNDAELIESALNLSVIMAKIAGTLSETDLNTLQNAALKESVRNQVKSDN